MKHRVSHHARFALAAVSLFGVASVAPAQTVLLSDSFDRDSAAACSRPSMGRRA